MTTAIAPDLIPSTRQRDAIEAELGPVLVLAGPGAGKTFCLIERIRFLIEHKGFDPGRICAVTFTNKAAQEIAERLQKTLGDRAREVKGGTLHALCAEVLRQHGEWVGVRRGFGIADEEYQKDVLRRLGVWEKRHGSVLSGFGRYRVGAAKLTPDDLRIFTKYQAFLQQRNLVDFDDLIVRTAELVEKYDEVAEELARRWDYILVDEFQDLNPSQYAIARRLAGSHRNVFVVGDDEQSVYSWTGADPRVLQQFVNDFQIKHIVVLDENRRNARQIFASARLLLQHNPIPFVQKLLRAERQSEYPVHALEFADEHAEVRWLLADLLADRARTDMSWGEYGMLYRRHEIGDALEAELVRAGIPCRLASGRALQDHPVIHYLVAALRVMAEPGDAIREEAFVRVVLPPTLWSTIESQAERGKQARLACMRSLAKRWGKDNEDARKLNRADYALQNLPALSRRHQTLAGLVEELLSQRVGEYRTVLEDRHDELSDPETDPAIVTLAARLGGALHGRKRVWLERMGGLELALSGLLLRCGVSSVAYLDGGLQPAADDVVIARTDGGRSGLAFGLFKALQIVRTGPLQDSFGDFVSLDLETTDFGLESCDIVELGAVRVREGRVVADYQQLVRPRNPISAAATLVHGIRNDDVREMPTLEEVWPEFRRFCGEDTLVAHNGNGFDFPILRRVGRDLGDSYTFPTFDSLPLARYLHPGSRKLEDLAHSFGIELRQAHRALPDAQALVPVFLRLQAGKRARARKTALSHLLDYLGLALVLSAPESVPDEARGLFKAARAFALGRYSDCLEHYQLERSSPAAFDAPTLEEVIRRFGGQRKLEQYRKARRADERYPAAMARLRRLLEEAPGEGLAEQLRSFLDRVALSRSDGSEKDPDLAHRVNLLTLHSTKGLEFSRVYIVGAEDAELPGIPFDGRGVSDAELQEARRLLYVGMTRAKDRLVLTRTERRKDLPTGGFRFLEEMGFKPTSPAPAPERGRSSG